MQLVVTEGDGPAPAPVDNSRGAGKNRNKTASGVSKMDALSGVVIFFEMLWAVKQGVQDGYFMLFFWVLKVRNCGEFGRDLDIL